MVSASAELCCQGHHPCKMLARIWLQLARDKLEVQPEHYSEPTNGGMSHANLGFGTTQVQPLNRTLEMHSLQGQQLEPQQLSRLLDWLTQASPAILVRPQASAHTAEAGADRKDTEMRDWICQLAVASNSTCRFVALSEPLTCL